MFAQAQRIHNLLPYSILKSILRFSNPIAMLRGILDLFLAQPFGQRSLLQRILSITLNDDIQKIQKNIDMLLDGETDLITAILRSEVIQPRLDGKQIVRIHTALLAWNSAVDAVRLASVRWS